MTKLSEHSKHYKNLDDEHVRRNVDQIDTRLERFRLLVDLEHLLPLARGPDVLDFPIGTGRFYPNLQGRFQVWGYDICGPYVERARTLNPATADHFHEACFEHIPINKTFDTVFSLRILNNIADLELAARNIAAILNPQGRWVFNYPPTGSYFARMDEVMGAAGLTRVSATPYDAHIAFAGMSRIETAIYTRFRRLIERGLVPYWVYRLFEKAYGHRGTLLWVYEKA